MMLSIHVTLVFRVLNGRLTSQLGESSADTSAAYPLRQLLKATADAIQQPGCRFFPNKASSGRTSPETFTNALSSGIDKAGRSLRKPSYLTYSCIPNRLLQSTSTIISAAAKHWHLFCT